MTFEATENGRRVWPDMVEHESSLTCLECGDSMHIVKGHTRSDGTHVAKHFRHDPEARVGGMCDGGESNPHRMMKYVAARKFHTMFKHGTVKREVAIDGTERIADVVVEFEDPIENLGKGVIAECQYKNHNKDISKVNQEYLQAGYSVYWLNIGHFSNDFRMVKFPDIVPVWPNAVPMPSYWRGVEHAWETLGSQGKPVRLPIIFPQEHLDSFHDELHSSFKRGARGFDIDMIVELRKENSPRVCEGCSRTAKWHIWSDGKIGTFRCPDHLPFDMTEEEAIEQNRFRHPA